jgi:hypothetical protein
MGAGDTGAVMVAYILAGMVREYNSTSVRVAARIGITAVVITDQSSNIARAPSMFWWRPLAFDPSTADAAQLRDNVAELADRDQWLDLAPPSSALAATSSNMETAEGRATSGADTPLKDLESL